MELSADGGVIRLINIILIDLVLAGDNAVVVSMAAVRVDLSIRRKVMAGAVVIPVLLASVAAYLLTTGQ